MPTTHLGKENRNGSLLMMHNSRRSYPTQISLENLGRRPLITSNYDVQRSERDVTRPPLSCGDALGRLIERAEHFRQSLIKAASETRPKFPGDTLKSRENQKFNGKTVDGLTESILIDSSDSCMSGSEDLNSLDACFAGIERSTVDVAADFWRSDIAEAALLNELFFSANKDTKTEVELESKRLVGGFPTGWASTFGNELSLSVRIGQVDVCDVSIQNLAEARTRPCTAVLDLYFPSASSEDGSLTIPEQHLSLCPIHMDQRSIYFEHLSQLYWKWPVGNTRASWCKQAIKVSLHIRWKTGESLDSCGYILLKNVLECMPSPFRTSLILTGPGFGCHNELSSLEGFIKGLPECVAGFADPIMGEITHKRAEEKPVAIVDIGLCAVDQKQEVVTNEMRDMWLYINLQGLCKSLYGLFFSSDSGLPKEMTVVLRSDINLFQKSFHLRKHGNKQVHVGCFGKTALDILSHIPSSSSNLIVFLEIWSSKICGSQMDRLDDLVGMVKISHVLRDTRVSGNYAIWHPYKKSVKATLEAVVLWSSEHTTNRLQCENRAATIIQWYARRFLKQRRNLTHSNHYSFLKQQKMDGITWHIFKLTVLEAINLPSSSEVMNARGFIKYIFPGEKEALYTPEVPWDQRLTFGACVHHRISLLPDEDLEEALQHIDPKKHGLRFEIWGVSPLRQGGNCSDIDTRDMSVSSYSSQRSGKLKRAAALECQEGYFGSASLSQASLLSLLDDAKACDSRNQKVKKLFCLPIMLDQNSVLSNSFSSKLLVEISYSCTKFSEQLLKGTIFEDQNTHVKDTWAPLKATLEVKILRAELKDIILPLQYIRPSDNGQLNSYVRFSLFPSNRDLELTYPPMATPSMGSPSYLWSSAMVISIDAEVLNELKVSEMKFELWHHIPQEREESRMPHLHPTEIWLATATACCLDLIKEKRGISGCLKLLSRKGEVAGSLEVDVHFSDWQHCVK